LRFLAGLLVVLHHFPGPLAAVPWIGNVLENGSTGVTFFFVLSGFILAYNYQGERIAVGPFLRARFARVYPVYLLGLLLALPFLLELLRWNVPEWPLSRVVIVTVSSVLLVQSWHPATAALLNPPGWSLAAEAFFYLAFPFVASSPRFRRLVSWPRLSLLALWGLGLLSTWLAVSIAGGIRGWNAEHAARFAGFSPWVRVPEFLLGALLGWIHLQGWGRVARPGAWAAGLVLVLLAILGVPRLVAENPYFHNGALSLLYGGIVLLLAQAGRTGILASRGAILLGEASYALYVLHCPILTWMEWIGKKAGTGFSTSSTGGLLVYLVVSVGTSVAVYRWIETPSRRWLRGRA